MLKSEPIEKIRKRYKKEWLLVAIPKKESDQARPQTGRLLAHSPRKNDIDKLMMRLKSPAFVTYSEDIFSSGYAEVIDMKSKKTAKIKSEKIVDIERRFNREWILVEVDKEDESTTTPISGRLIFHSPHRHEVYQKMLSMPRKKGTILFENTSDSLPEGYAAAF